MATFRREALPLLAVLGTLFASSLLLSPLRDIAVSDEWTYAWSVEHLLGTGRLAVLDWSAHYPIFQTVWGGLFSALFGFSFGVLRVSTVVLAALGCVAFYLTLRELDVDRSRSLLGTLALLLNPIFFLLSFSFMTDVPFLAAMNAAVFFYVAGVKRDRPAWLWVGGLFAVLAFLSRQIGIVIPLALLPTLARRDSSGVRAKLAPLLAALAAMGLLWHWEWSALGRTSVMGKKLDALGSFSPFDLEGLLKDAFVATAQSAFYFFPLLMAGLSLKPRRRLLLVAGIAVASALALRATDGFPSALGRAGTWSIDELGDARRLMPGAPTEGKAEAAVIRTVQALMLVSWSILVAGAGGRLLQWFREGDRRSRLHDLLGSPGAILVALGVLHIGVIHALWFYYDRYYLALFPSLIYIALRATEAAFSKAIAAGGVALLAVAALAGTWDNLRFSQATWDAYHELRAAGVAAADINAGYAINGWMLYAHPENLRSGEDARRDVPWVTSGEERPYAIARSALAGFEVVKGISWVTVPWAPSSEVFILRKTGAPAVRLDEAPVSSSHARTSGVR